MAPLLPLFAQVGAYSIAQLLIACIVIGAIVYIFNAVVELPAQVKLIINVVLVAIVAIVAIKILLSFV
jgi:hypothetical protein